MQEAYFLYHFSKLNLMKESFLFVANLFVCLFFSSVSYAQAQGWEWGKIGYSSSNMEGSNVAVGTDDEGSIGIYGVMDNELGATMVTFGSVVVYNPNGYRNAIVVKYDTAGNASWGYNVPCNSSPIGIATDSHGNAYLFCSFTDSVLLGSTTLRTTFYSYFIAKISPSGSILWAVQDGDGCSTGFSPEWYNANNGGIICDASNNIYVSSYYNTKTTTIGPYTLTNSDTGGSSDIFIAKYDSAGHVIWAKGAGGKKEDLLRAFTVTPKGKACIAGTFSSPTITFGSLTVTNPSATGQNIFIAMYDSSGNAYWAEATGSDTASAPTNYVSWLASDKYGDFYITGTFFDSITIAGKTIINPNGGTGSLYLAKLDTTQHVDWYKTACSPPGLRSSLGIIYSLGLAVDQCGIVWVEGSMGGGFSKGFPYVNISGSIIDSAPLVFEYPHYEQDPGFIAGFNSSGGFFGGKALESGFDDMNFIACGSDGAVYLVSDFEGGYLITAHDTINDSGGEYFLIAKYKYECSQLETPELASFSPVNVNIYPNPAYDEITIKTDQPFPENSKAMIYDLTGRLINTHSLTGNTTDFSVSGFPPGLYECRICTGGENVIIKKVVVMK